MKKILSLLCSLMLCVGLVGCSNNDGIKGYDVEFDLSNDRDEIKTLFENYEISYSGADYIIYEEVNFDKEFTSSLRFNFNEDGTIKSVSQKFLDVDPSHIVNNMVNLYGEPVHKENYNDKRVREAYFVWENKSVITNLSLFPLMNKEINASITFYPNNDEFKLRQSNYSSAQDKIQDNIKKDEGLKKDYDILISRSSLKSKPINEAIEYGATYQEEFGYEFLFVENAKLFGLDTKIIYTVRNPEDDKNQFAAFEGQIQDIYFELKEDDILKLLPQAEKVFGEDYSKKNGNYYWSDSMFNYVIDEDGMFNDDGYIEIRPSTNFDLHLLDYNYNYTDDLTEFEAYKDCDIDKFIQQSNNQQQNNDKFIAKGDRALMPFLTSSTDNGFSIIDPNRNGSIVKAKLKNTSSGETLTDIVVEYFVENQKVFCVETIANSSDIMNTEEFIKASIAMAKSINPNISDESARQGIEQALNSDEAVVLENMQYLKNADKNSVAISY